MPSLSINRFGVFGVAVVVAALLKPQAVLPRDVLFQAHQAAAIVAAKAYDQQTVLTVHNAYEQPMGLLEQLTRTGLRSLEVDIQPDKRGRPALRDDWYVYHRDLPLFDDSRCTRLSECLERIADFHAGEPQHEPVTLFVDLKEPFGGTQSPEALDGLLAEHLGRNTLYTPADLVARCEGARSPAEAVRKCGWPTVQELRGRFLVALTGGGSCEPDLPLAGYAKDASTALSRLAFLAPSIEGSCTRAEYEAHQPQVVFFNLDWAQRDEVAKLRPSRFVSRLYQGGIYGGLDDERLVAALKAERPTFLATDRLDWP
ncbi:MAG: Ca2+-dependent phosphoinositide-specific phospholipase C [Myxococcales bacterium]